MMSARLAFLVIGILVTGILTATGCVMRIGSGAEAFPVANAPAGALTAVSLGTGITVTGELLEVRDTALVLRRDNEVLLVPKASITYVRFPGDVRIRSVTPDEIVSRQVRLLSRYPSGITPAVMAELLSASGKPEPTVVR